MNRELALAACLMLGACASGANTGAMIVPVSQANIIDAKSPLHGAIAVAGVSGGQKTNPMWTSEVSNEAFLEALKQSLSAHLLLGNDTARYKLTAELLEVKQPMFGFDMKVTAKVKYTLAPAAGGAPILEKIIETPYTAAMSDAFVAVKRLQLANEGAIRTNIQALIDTLIAEAKANPALAAANAAVLGQLQLLLTAA